MNWNDRLKAALGQTLDDDVVEELAQHAAATYASARAEGCDAAEAERRADLQIAAWTANPSLLRRRAARPPAVLPPAGRATPLAATLQDARYAWRLLRQHPAY